MGLFYNEAPFRGGTDFLFMLKWEWWIYFRFLVPPLPPSRFAQYIGYKHSFLLKGITFNLSNNIRSGVLSNI